MTAYLAASLLALAVLGIVVSLCWMAVEVYRTIRQARAEERRMRIIREHQQWRARAGRHLMAAIDKQIDRRKRGA